MNSKTKELLESFGLIFLFNYLWIFVHSYLNNYILFRPINLDITYPESIFLWNTYVALISKLLTYAFINSLSMFVVISIITFYKNSDIKFQFFVSFLIILFNIIFSFIISIIFASLKFSVANIIIYSIYFMVPWILFLVIYNKYYISGFGHILLYFFIGTFIFTILFIMKNNSIVYKEKLYKKKIAKKQQEELKNKFEKKRNENKESSLKNDHFVQKSYQKPKSYYPENIRLYPFKSGKIIYEISGTGMTAKESLYFDHYGLRELTLTETHYSNGNKEKQMILLDKNYIFIIDMNSKIGTIAISNLLKNLGNNFDYMDVLKYRLKQLNPILFGTGYVLGKNCKIWISQDKKIRIWTWKGLILKKIIYKNDLPSIIYEAKEIEINKKIPENRFEIPKSVKFIKYNKL